MREIKYSRFIITENHFRTIIKENDFLWEMEDEMRTIVRKLYNGRYLTMLYNMLIYKSTDRYFKYGASNDPHCTLGEIAEFENVINNNFKITKPTILIGEVMENINFYNPSMSVPWLDGTMNRIFETFEGLSFIEGKEVNILYFLLNLFGDFENIYLQEILLKTGNEFNSFYLMGVKESKGDLEIIIRHG